VSVRRICAVIARARNGVIGRDGGLPWHLPADLRHFKAKTEGRALVMGRRTFASLPGPLPGRPHIVLTRNAGWRADGMAAVSSPQAAIAAAGDMPIAVIGGAEILALMMPWIERVELTEIEAEPEGDTLIPPFDPAIWDEVAREPHEPEGGRPGYSFVTLLRHEHVRAAPPAI
jgi:dihydrofolate reductase